MSRALPIRYELIDKDGKVFPYEFETATDAVLCAVRMWPDQEQDRLRQGQGWDIQAISRKFAEVSTLAPAEWR